MPPHRQASTIASPSMIRGLFWARKSLKRSPSPIRNIRCFGHQTINATEKVEEESLPWYTTEGFYNILIGNVYNSRYKVVGKLGYGSCSTVWLCRDLHASGYVVMKVYERDTPQATRELEIHRRLKSISTGHEGSNLVRMLLDHFSIPTTGGNHICLIHPPLGISLAGLRARSRDRKLPEIVLKLAVIHLFYALDFLHSEAGVVHGGTYLQENNILLGIEDESVLPAFEKEELDDPSPQKLVGDKVIYRSRPLRTSRTVGRPILCDFGEARVGSTTYHEDIQPFIYRAPEVVLRMRWDSKVDIWNTGVLIWDLFENKHVFGALDEEKQNSNAQHLAEMVAILGPPPDGFIRQSEYAREFFDEQGRWKHRTIIPNVSLVTMETNLSGSDQKPFLEFMRKMLQWSPDARQSAKQLLTDPWLRSR